MIIALEIIFTEVSLTNKFITYLVWSKGESSKLCEFKLQAAKDFQNSEDHISSLSEGKRSKLCECEMQAAKNLHDSSKPSDNRFDIEKPEANKRK